MLALTMHRPWDQAIVRLGKSVENRNAKPWRTFKGKPLFGQRIAIHGGHAYDRQGAQFILDTTGCVLDPDDCPTGIIGVGTLIGWFERDSGDHVCIAPYYDVMKHAMRDGNPWAFGPFCWVFADPVALPKPVACGGKQGFWEVPANVEAAVRGQL